VSPGVRHHHGHHHHELKERFGGLSRYKGMQQKCWHIKIGERV